MNVKEMVGLSVGGIYMGRIRFDTKNSLFLGVAYMWGDTNVKEMVCLSVGGLYVGRRRNTV